MMTDQQMEIVTREDPRAWQRMEILPSQLSWDGTTRKKMSRQKSHQNRLVY